MSILSKPLASLYILGLLAVAGCQGTPSTQSSAATPQQAVLITGAHGTAIVMKTDDPANPKVLASDGMPICETCKRDAIESFKTGKLDKTCPECGATRTKVAMLNPPANNHMR